MNRMNYYSNTPHKTLYILPNLITATCLILGFYAIIFAMDHRYKAAAICIILAGIADILDGRIARFTNTQSEFGKKFDSIADMVAFGMAPPLLIYQWSLSTLDWFGTMVAASYVLSVALRLARFGLQSNHDNFLGLPCPPTSCMLAAFVWLGASHQLHPLLLSMSMACMMLLLSVFMISHFQYNSLKAIPIRKHVVSFILLIGMTIAAACYIGLPQVLFMITLMYVLSGPLYAGYKVYFK